MHALSAAELLNVWERGLTQSPAERALTLLGAACPEISPESLTKLTVGDRDARLMTLREWTFGSQFVCVAACSNCGERLELDFNAADLRIGSAPPATETHFLSFDGFELCFRLPNSRDLAALANCQDIETGRQFLLERCITTIAREGAPVAYCQVPKNLKDAVVERMGQIDPQGDVQLTLSCPWCSHQCQSVFDIEAFFWKEICGWAGHILKEVHTLASAYGWNEVDILNLTYWRRQLYLNLVTG